MKRPYFGITGVTDTDHVAAIMSHVNNYPTKFGPYQIMIGVLANYDTICGRQCTRYPKRYPEPARSGRLFPNSTDTLNLYHYNTPNQDFYNELEKLIHFGGENLDGFQLNIAWPDPRVLQRFREQGNKQTIVQQVGGKAFDRVDNDPAKLVAKIKVEYLDLVDYILLDPSDGQGREMNVETQRKYLSALYNSGLNENE